MSTDRLMRPLPMHHLVLPFNYEKKVAALSFWQWTKGVVSLIRNGKGQPTAVLIDHERVDNGNTQLILQKGEDKKVISLSPRD